MKDLPELPFDTIALGMSGGGYRATSFHLGAMCYLDRVQFKGKPLLENVKTISTVSGGTITGVVYAICKADNQTFKEFYLRLVGQLRKRDLVKEGIDKLKIDAGWESSTKRRNLINAMSELYDQHFTNGAMFEKFLDKDSKSHLDLVVFNATEFNTGKNFRFQNSGVLGNSSVNVKKQYKGEIKLGDVIAASSCFPGGFEPIGFPNDFVHENSPNLKKYLANEDRNETGLMDGGIFDNQGIDAILLSENRKNIKPYELIIISDVSSGDMKDFSFYKKSEKKSKFQNYNLKDLFRKIGQLKSYAIWFLVLFFLAGVATAFLSGLQNNIGTGIGIAVVIFAVLVSLVYFLVKNRIGKLVDTGANYVKNLIPTFFYERLKVLDIGDYRIGDYEPLAFDRIKSLLQLLQDVFLKQIRRLSYARVYDNDDYKFRRVSNLSKELTKPNFEARTKSYQRYSACPEEMKKEYSDLLGAELSAMITTAANFGTNLWFTKEDELNDILDQLIISGQATMCFNLLTYIYEIKSESEFESYPTDIKKEIAMLEKKLEEDWHKFVANPHFMIYELEGHRA